MNDKFKPMPTIKARMFYCIAQGNKPDSSPQNKAFWHDIARELAGAIIAMNPGT